MLGSRTRGIDSEERAICILVLHKWKMRSDRSSRLSSIGKNWDSITINRSVAKYALIGESNEMKPGSKSL
jgi:hypothetical protein